jgi:hypothetical protein
MTETLPIFTPTPEDIKSRLRPSLRLVGRSYSGSTFSITGTNKKRYVFLREGKNMVLRFASWEAFHEEQEAVIRGARVSKMVVDLEVGEPIVSFEVNTDEFLKAADALPPLEITDELRELLAEPEPEIDPVIKAWRAKRLARSQALNRKGNRKIQAIVESLDLEIPVKSPRQELINAILDEEFGSEQSMKIAPDGDGDEDETQNAIPAVIQSSVRESRWNTKELYDMPLDGDNGLRALGAKYGHSGTRKEIVDGLMGGAAV